MSIYTDGACKNNRDVEHANPPAGWGFVVTRSTTAEDPLTGEVVAESCGPVVCKPDSEFFLGAEHGSNNTGELSAVAEAMLWSLRQPGNASPSLLQIHVDSEIFAEARRKFKKVSFVWVKAH